MGIGTGLTVLGLYVKVPKAVKVGWLIISNAMTVSGWLGEYPPPNDIPYVYNQDVYDRYAYDAFRNLMTQSH
jgi:hypothetical protein